MLTKPSAIGDYAPHWPLGFAQEKQRLLAVLAPLIVPIEHIGSTAVSGLAAK